MDMFINVSIGTIKLLDMRSKPLCSTLYMTFDDLKAGNSLKDRSLHSELKECMYQLLPQQRGFHYSKAKVLLLLRNVITVHKTQGSALDYMQGDLNQFIGKKTTTRKDYQQPIYPDV